MFKTLLMIFFVFLLLALTIGCSTVTEGTISLPEGTYTGQIKNNIPHGEGTLTYPDGTEYVGQWKDGKEHGQGIVRWRVDGDTAWYSGEWVDGKWHGNGIFSYPDGTKYEGKWKEGERHGQGVETYNGTEKVGEWKDGTFYEGTIIHQDGRKVIWKNGREVN